MKSKLLSFSIALLASICLWIYVVTVVNPEGTVTIYGIPVTYAGEEDLREEQNLVITDGAEQTVSLRLNGKRSVLNKLENDNISVLVDVARIRKAGSFNLSYTVAYPSGVSSGDIDELDRDPGVITFQVEELASKTVEVKGVLDGDVAPGYIADQMIFDYGEIMIEGPVDLIETVSYAQVILSRTNVDQTVTATVPFSLIDDRGHLVYSNEITSDVEEIEVTLPVLQYKEVPLAVNFLDGGGASAESDVVYKIEPSTVTIAGDPVILESINQINLGSIDLAEIMGDEKVSLPVTIPEGMKNVSGDGEAIVDVSIRGLESKTVRASNINVVGTPAGYTATSITQMLQVTVRASSSDIDRISTDNLRVVADLSKAELTKVGSYTVPVTIYIDGVSRAGVIGDYSIVVLLASE